MRKEILFTKNTYMLKLFINIVTIGNEALVSGNKFLYACHGNLPPVGSGPF
jgi:hypothetical protein